MNSTDGLTAEFVRDEIAPRFSIALTAERYRNEVYLANHSLGRPLDKTSIDVRGALELWYARMDACWEDDDGWMSEQDLWRSNTARLIGLPSYDCVVPKTSAGQGLRAVLNALIGAKALNVVATTGEFDSIDFILKTYAAKGLVKVRWVVPSSHDQGVPLFESRDIVAATGADTDLVVFSSVFYQTGQVLKDASAVVAKAHQSGALVLCDFYHAAGVVPLDMSQFGCDFAIGGSYKYLRGGPGACWLAIHPATFAKGLRTLDTGWFAKSGTFDYARPDEPNVKPRGDGWLESTPSILAPYQAKAGLELALEIGVERLREYGLRQLDLLTQAFVAQGVPLYTPPDRRDFGAFALLPHSDSQALEARIKQAGVNVDSRLGFVRLGPDMLNTQEEFERAASAVKSVL